MKRWEVIESVRCDGQLFGVDNILSTFFYKVKISFNVLLKVEEL